jgi:hypothetical protein
MRFLRTSVVLAGMAAVATVAAQVPDAPAPVPAKNVPASQVPTGSSSSSGSPANQGGCYDTDKNGKEVFIPNCGLGDTPARKSVQTPAASGQPADPAKQFPFPGEAPAATSGQAPAGQQTPTAAKQFPFPGEANTPEVQPDGSIKPADGSVAGPLKDAGSSGESSSSSSSSSSSDRGAFGGLPEDPDKGPLADDDTVIRKPRKVLPKEKPQTAGQRVDEDLSVASFYMNINNFRAAYLRAADAVQYAKDDPNAHFALAEAARKLGKLDEALTNYKETIALDPVPKLKKQAEEAMKQMSGKSS